MGEKRKVICPKCKAKLAFDPDKLSSAVTKFSCPNCKTALSIRKTGSETAVYSSPAKDPMKNRAGNGLNELAGGSGKQGLKEQDLSGAGKTGGESFAGQDDDRAGRTNSREFKRVRFKKKILVNKQIMVEALDISRSGLFLHTGRSFEDGAVIEVGIPTRPGNFDLTVRAMVRHNHRGIGMGMMFVDMDDTTVMQLEKLIDELGDTATNDLAGRKKVLLTGGTTTTRNINKSKLVLDGFYVQLATTADEIFEILERETVDVMVLDWQDTEYNCKEVLTKIWETPAYEKIIRVVLSVFTDSGVQQEIMDAGAHRCMARMDTNPAKLSLTLSQLIAARDG